MKSNRYVQYNNLCYNQTRQTMEQLTLRLTSTRGGARPGAGRKKSPHSGPPHVRRERLSPRVPVHVTVRFERGLPSMRSQVLARSVMAQIGRARERFWRVVHFSVQATHLHLVVEVENEQELGRAMQGLGVRVAKNVNRLLCRKGAVVAGRHHAHPLRTPREVRNAIAYVMCNAQKHGILLSGWDPGRRRPGSTGGPRRSVRVPSGTANECPFPWRPRKPGSSRSGGNELVRLKLHFDVEERKCR